MAKKAINKIKTDYFTNSAIELVKWPLNVSQQLDDKVVALQTTRLSPLADSSSPTSLIPQPDSTFGAFNLGQHVGDCVKQVTENRETLRQVIRQKLVFHPAQTAHSSTNELKVQWLDQVHGNEVITVKTASESPLTADACITREKNIALAIMTADCLPILLTDKNGDEIAAIHGGWRSLAANIIAQTIKKMHSKPNEIVAWLGPCIGPSAFEVGSEVKENFCQQNITFKKAFIKQGNGKFLANLHTIARLQLISLDIYGISSLPDCTYQQANKYYSYRKDKTTGRMASIICRY